jgi:hypothetical protein
MRGRGLGRADARSIWTKWWRAKQSYTWSGVGRGQIHPKGDLSSLETNMVVTQILDAARESATDGEDGEAEQAGGLRLRFTLRKEAVNIPVRDYDRLKPLS